MKTVATTDLCDHYLEELTVAEPIGFKDFGKRKSFHGEIVTIHCPENNPLVRKTLGENGKGKVLVVDGEGSTKCALMGDNIAKLAVENGWEGVIINGCIRDSAEISTLDVGVKALNVIPVKSGKKETGVLNIAVDFAGVTFVPGEFVYADEDGIVVSPKKYY
ncbi:ribonuclease E activity regulator RraA [Weeksellaceae bacterium A-14]